MWLFYYFYFERTYEVWKSKSLCFLLNKNIDFYKNETKSENATSPTPPRHLPPLLIIVKSFQPKQTFSNNIHMLPFLRSR